MSNTLPKDLKEAETMLLTSSLASLVKNPLGRWSITLRFEGLKVLPLVIRYSKQLATSCKNHYLAFPDAGAAALAKRDYPEMSQKIMTFTEIIKKTNSNDTSTILVTVCPTPPDYEIFEELTKTYSGPLIMINGRLEDSMVGIGSVARERRKRFLSLWNVSFWLEPLKNGALIRMFPHKWKLFRLTDFGYVFDSEYEDRPAQEIIFEKL